jgi:PAS domain S-box-containing protein
LEGLLSSPGIAERDLAEAIVRTMSEPLAILDDGLRLLAANDAFYDTFQVRAADSQGRQLYELGNGHWNIPELRQLLEQVVAGNATFDNYEVVHDLERNSSRTMLLNARILHEPGAKRPKVLLGITDITERKRTEEAAAHLAAIVISSDDAIISKNLQGILLTWNKSAENLFGYTAEEAIGQPATILIPGDRQDEEPEILRTVGAGGTIDHFETVRRHKDGSLLDISLTISPIRDAKGNIIGIAKTARDIRALKKAERELRTSEERYRTLFASVDQGFCVIDMVHDDAGKPCDYRFVEVNPAFEAQTGLRHATGRTIRELAPDHEQVWFERYGEVARTGEAVTFTSEAKALGRWFEVHAFRLNDGARQVGVLFKDVTEQRRHDQALREGEQQYRQLVHALSAAVYTTDVQGRVQLWNEAAVDLWGRTPEIGRDLWSGAAKIFRPDGSPLPLDACPMAVAVKEGRPVLGEEIIIERPNGTRRHVAPFPQVLRDTSGAITGAVNMLMDITQHKLLENTLMSVANELLENDKRKNEFLAMLAHELRNPLAPLRFGLEVLHEMGGAEAGMLEVQGMMQRQVEHMVRLVDDLLDVGRVSSGKITLRKERVDLRLLLRQVAEATQLTMEDLGQHLSVVLPEGPLPVHGDPARLAQVVGNLLNNASKFSERYGEVELSATVQDGHVLVRVKDHGIGLGAEEIPRIFDLFVQVDSTVERSTTGLGIGLTLVKNLVQMHGGTVEVRSEGHGKGSSFTVSLPLLAEDPVPEVPAKAPAPEAATGRKVLVVDDNRDAAELLAMILGRRGHTVRKAHDGNEGITMAASFRPEVILLDIGLPNLNGYEVAKRIRKEEWGRSICLVALTGWGQQEDMERSAEAGFDRHLVKPVDLAVLMDLLGEEAQ